MLTIVLDARKRSAGFLVIAGRRILLLKRAKHCGNGGRWGLPGGQFEDGEAAYAAALRESVEELAGLPGHALVGSIAVQRGARRYEVMACRVRKRTRRQWAPTLDDEHVAWRWANQAWLARNRRRLHPVVAALVDDARGRRWLDEMVTTREPSALPGGRRSTDGIRRAA